MPLQRKGATEELVMTSSPFSAVQFVYEESRDTGVIRVFGAPKVHPFSAVETEWRSTQSRANPSPPKLPANREKCREFVKFCPRKCTLLSLSCTFCWGSSAFSPNRNRGLAGTYQGIKFPDRDLFQEEFVRQFRQCDGPKQRRAARALGRPSFRKVGRSFKTMLEQPSPVSSFAASFAWATSVSPVGR